MDENGNVTRWKTGMCTNADDARQVYDVRGDEKRREKNKVRMAEEILYFPS
jgi:hypothetical protein